MRFSTVLFVSVAVALGLASSSHALPNPLTSILSHTPTTNASITTCGTDQDLLQIDYINIIPNPPERGKNLTIDAKGALSEDIVEGATIELLVKLGLVKLVQKKLDFCEESAKIDKNCPVQKGDQSLTHTVELPKEIPPGTYSVNVKVKNPDGQQVACLNARATFKIIPSF